MRCPRQSIRPMPRGGSPTTTRRPWRCGATGHFSVPANGAVHGSCSGRTAHRWRTINARWRSRSRKIVPCAAWRLPLNGKAERPDGTRVPFIPYPTPIHDETGHLIGAVNMVNITDRKRAEEQQTLLIRELHHRVKNTLAMVQAITGSTARAVDNIEDFKTALFGRIQSLAKTHLLLADNERAVSFNDILHSELDAFDDGSNERVVLRGPDVRLNSRLAVSLGMAIHKLTANEAQFGALSVFGGQGRSHVERNDRSRAAHVDF